MGSDVTAGNWMVRTKYHAVCGFLLPVTKQYLDDKYTSVLQGVDIIFGSMNKL